LQSLLRKSPSRSFWHLQFYSRRFSGAVATSRDMLQLSKDRSEASGALPLVRFGRVVPLGSSLVAM